MTPVSSVFPGETRQEEHRMHAGEELRSLSRGRAVDAMTRGIARAVAAAVLAALAVATAPVLGHDAGPPPSANTDIVLDPGLGLLRHPVSTRNAQAQAYFDQGLKLVF